MACPGFIELPVLEQIYTFDIYTNGSNFPHAPGVYLIVRLKDLKNPSVRNIENILYFDKADDLEQAIKNVPDWKKLHEDGADTVLVFLTANDEQRRTVYQNIKDACIAAGS